MTNDVQNIEKDEVLPPAAYAGVMLDDNGDPISLVVKGGQTVEERLNEEKEFEDAVKRGDREPTEDRFGTGGMHTARHKEGAIGWREKGMNVKGTDPLNTRDYKGDEFDGIIAYGRADEDGLRRPAFWSHFVKEDKTDPNRPLRDEQGNVIPGTPIESIDDLPEQPVFKICLPAKGEFPEHLKNNPSIERTREAWGTGKPEDQAEKIHPRLIKAMEDIVKNSENSGIKIELVDDPKEAHCNIMGWSTGATPRLLGWASFPEAMNSWSRLRGLGQERGSAFSFLNNDYAADRSVSDEALRDLILHEVVRGHVMGGCHPHDLGMLRMSQAEAKESTLMSYSTDHPNDFAGTEGSGLGMIDYGIRRWMPNPKPINTQPGNVYDIAAHVATSFERNKNGRSAYAAGLLPGVVIINHGPGAVLKGTAGDDILDTNPGYCSVVPAGEHRGKQFKQKVLLSEGHIEVVKGISGNNTIIPAEQGNQLIEPGTGNSKLCFTHQSIGGNKHIHSEGQDTLVLSDAVVKRYLGNLKASINDKGEMVFAGGDDSITVSGNKLASMQIVNARGGVIGELNGADLTVDKINNLLTNLEIPSGIEHGPHTAKLLENRANDNEKGPDRGVA